MAFSSSQRAEKRGFHQHSSVFLGVLGVRCLTDYLILNFEWWFHWNFYENEAVPSTITYISLSHSKSVG